MTVRPVAQAETVLRLRGITKRFGALVANDAIDLDLGKGEVVALLGENGAGKTTLMNILFGHYVADTGTIEAFGRRLPPSDPGAAIAAGIGMVHQHFTLADNLSVLDNVILGTESLWRLASRRAEAKRRLLGLAGAFGLRVDPDAPVSGLSVGEQQRVEILKALYRKARILILDEPTAVLTPQESDSLRRTFRRLVGEGLSIVFISHKLDEVLDIGDRVVVLRAGKVAGEMPTAGADRHRVAEMMVGREVVEPARQPRPPGRTVVELDRLTVAAGDGPPALDDVSLAVRAGEIVGIAGVSGNGQKTLSDVLSGLIAPMRGAFRLDGEDAGIAGVRALVRRGVGRIPEDRHASGVIGDMTIAETLIAEDYAEPPYARFGIADRRAVAGFARRIVDEFDVRCEGPAARARLLSGGNMQKLLLGRVLARDPRFILANQPTRGLDVGAAAFVHGRLLEARERGAAILLISEDLDEILQMSDRVAVIFRGRLGPALARDGVDARVLGLMMAGQGAEAAHAS
ncbi:MAG: ABC transporter ATP-binding protein [Rhodospirillales bacterium]|nr:ABC transporter ATP-binding protein [Rhodospirillales bacterium]